MSLNIILIILSVIYSIRTENDFDDRSSSIDSDSREIYNTSSKEKPQLGRVIENSKLTVDDIYFDNSTNEKSVSKLNSLKMDKQKMKSLADFPFSVSVQRRGSHYASGALIDKRWILTVAELFYHVRESIKLYKARLGSVNSKLGGTLVHLKGIEIHPEYVLRQPNNDLALLRVAGVLDIGLYIRPISLSMMEEPVTQEKFWSTYWPRLIVRGSILSPNASERIKRNSMRISTQTTIPRRKCERVLSTFNITLDESSFCLEPIISHHSPCMPDPGAPVVDGDVLWGITSGWTSEECPEQPSPTVFTKVSTPTVRSWIDSIVHEA